MTEDDTNPTGGVPQAHSAGTSADGSGSVPAPVREAARFSVAVKALDHVYRLMHVTDVHVSTAYPYEPEPFQKEAELRGGAYFPPYGGHSAASRFPLFIQKAAELGLDGVLLTGDIIDFASRSNLDILSRTLSAAPLPAVYCLGNHDWSSMYEYHSDAYRAALGRNFGAIVNRTRGAADEHGREYLPQSPLYRLEDLGGFMIFAVDNTCDRIPPEVAAAAETVFAPGALGKPVLVACHVPFLSLSLVEPTFKYWNTVILLGKGGIEPDAPTQRFIDLMLAPESPVCAVAAGHIHFSHEDVVGDRLPQFVTAEGHRGDYGIIELRPA